MPATLDPRKTYATRQHGDLVVVFTWVNDERAMVLLASTFLTLGRSACDSRG